MIELTQLPPNNVPHWAKTSAFNFVFSAPRIKNACAGKISPRWFSTQTLRNGDIRVFAWNTMNAYEFIFEPRVTGRRKHVWK